MSDVRPRIYDFGDFRIDTGKRLLLRAGEHVPLTDQGQTLEQVLASQPTADYDASVDGGTTPLPGGGTSADRFVSTIYAELQPAAARDTGF